MSDHKAYCNCPTCLNANALNSSGKAKCFLPKHVLNQIQEKKAKEEELMMLRGMMLIACPSCKHRTYMKIGPIIKCGCCMHEIK